MTSNQVGLYSLYDKNIGMFCPPFFAQSDDDAKRMVADAIEVDSILARFPSDYLLYRCGTFDSAVGVFDYSNTVLCSVLDIARREVVDKSRVNARLDDPRKEDCESE